MAFSKTLFFLRAGDVSPLPPRCAPDISSRVSSRVNKDWLRILRTGADNWFTVKTYFEDLGSPRELIEVGKRILDYLMDLAVFRTPVLVKS